MVSDQPIERYESRRSVVHARNGIVATSQPLAAEAGVEILRAGGNAFDAAVATAATLSVVEPHNTGLGGDVFALYRTADGEVGGMRSCGHGPRNVDRETLRAEITREETNGPPSAIPERSPHSITVPGTASGWERTVERLGTMAFAETLEPAIDYAVEGFPVSEIIADQWQQGETVLTGDAARDTYLVDGEAPSPGEVVRLESLGETLRTLAEDGADAVYDGELGEQIVETVQERGGFLDMDDMRGFEAEFVTPIETTYNGATVYELPPNNQGAIVLEALNLAEELGTEDHPHLSPESVHLLIEAMKIAFHDGHDHITDPEFETIPPLVEKEYARERADGVTATSGGDPTLAAPNPDDDTVLLTVADGEGNLVSYINSIYAAFGSGIVAGDTGVLLQNRGSSFSLEPDHPNRFEPGKRPFHTLIPGVVQLAEDDWAAFGVMGGYMQPQGHLQVLTNLVDYDLSLQGALDVPRWRYRESGAVSVEPRMDAELLGSLVRRGHEVNVDVAEYFGGGQIVRANGDVLSGATDPRKDGAAIGF